MDGESAERRHWGSRSAPWMDRETVILSEVHQAEKEESITCMWNLKQ